MATETIIGVPMTQEFKWRISLHMPSRPSKCSSALNELAEIQWVCTLSVASRRITRVEKPYKVCRINSNAFEIELTAITKKSIAEKGNFLFSSGNMSSTI
jgi:hypothetical protein